MKTAILGCKGTTLDLLHNTWSSRSFRVDQVVTLNEESAAKNTVAFYRGEEIARWCEERGIPVYVTRSYHLKDGHDLDFFRSARIDLLIVGGWERLVPMEVLLTLGKFACGMHGSAFGLPRGRGRSPLNWSLITDQNQFITYLFRYDAGVDAGPIIDSKMFTIHPFDTISSLHAKNRIAMLQLLKAYVPLIERNEVTFVPQPPEPPTFYPKRRPEDGGIDWRRPTTDIYNLIRAVAPPYPPAYCFLSDTKIFIHDAVPFDTVLFEPSLAPGTVVDVSPALGQFIVKTSDGSLLIRVFEGVSIDDVTPGTLLGGVDAEAILLRIRENYPPEVPAAQREI